MTNTENTTSTEFPYDADAFEQGRRDAMPSGQLLCPTATDKFKAAEFVRDNASNARSYWYAVGEMCGLLMDAEAIASARRSATLTAKDPR